MGNFRDLTITSSKTRVYQSADVYNLPFKTRAYQSSDVYNLSFSIGFRGVQVSLYFRDDLFTFGAWRIRDHVFLYVLACHAKTHVHSVIRIRSTEYARKDRQTSVDEYMWTCCFAPHVRSACPAVWIAANWLSVVTHAHARAQRFSTSNLVQIHLQRPHLLQSLS